MPTDLDMLNIQTIREDIGRYRNLFHHRSVILEGIRKVVHRKWPTSQIPSHFWKSPA